MLTDTVFYFYIICRAPQRIDFLENNFAILFTQLFTTNKIHKFIILCQKFNTFC